MVSAPKTLRPVVPRRRWVGVEPETRRVALGVETGRQGREGGREGDPTRSGEGLCCRLGTHGDENRKGTRGTHTLLRSERVGTGVGT